MTTQYIIVNRYDGELYNGLNIKRFYDTPGLAWGVAQKHRSAYLVTILAVELGADTSVQQVEKYSGFTVQEFDSQVAAFRKRQIRMLKSDKKHYLPKFAGEKWALDAMQKKQDVIDMLESLRYEDLVYK